MGSTYATVEVSEPVFCLVFFSINTIIIKYFYLGSNFRAKLVYRTRDKKYCQYFQYFQSYCIVTNTVPSMSFALFPAPPPLIRGRFAKKDYICRSRLYC
jgi:hypothetical protein